MTWPQLYREEVGDFAFELEPFASNSKLFRAHFFHEDEIGWCQIGGESLSWDEFGVIILQARMRLNQLFKEECDQLDWEIYIMSGSVQS